MVDLIDVPRATVELVYGHKDISHDIAPYFLSLTYDDNLNGESDSLTITLMDTDKKWRDEWYPNKGDSIQARIAFNDAWLNCGTFEIDEIELGGENVVTLHALATGISSPMRTRQSKAFEGTTLGAIAAKFAAKHNLVLSGQIREISIGRVSQYHETDLGFLRRVGKLHGYLFSVKKGRLLFSELAELRNITPTDTITEDMLQASWHIRDKVHGVYQSVVQSRHDAKKRKTTSYTSKAASNVVASGDALRQHSRATNKAAAQVQSQAALDHANIEQTTGTLPLKQGNTRYVSGVAIALSGIGALSGTYQIDKTTHSVDRDGGYTTTIDVKRTDKLPVLAKHPAKKVATTKPVGKVVKLQGHA